jgi:hypothetical protein
MNLKSIFFLTLISISQFFTGMIDSVAAAEFSVTPLIIDVAGEPRDTFIHNLTLKNNDNKNLRLYASVNEIEIENDSEIKSFVPASMSDRTTSVTSWLEISRGRIDLPLGEEKVIPLTIRINQNAEPGLYHAFIGFETGSNRDEAEAKILAGQGSGVVLRISIGSKKEEFLRLVSFTTDRFSFGPESGQLTYVLENTGGVPLAPKGDIIIYDNRGKELTTVTIAGGEESIISPGEQKTYTEKLPFTNRIGKNKAFLSVEYGEVNRAAVYDTNFYFSIPWPYLITIMVLLLVLMVIVLLLLRRNSQDGLYSRDEADDLPVYVRKVKEHSEYEHDINLKKKDN